MGMVIVCLVAIAYAFFGKYLHGKIRHTGTTVKRMAEQMSLSTNGIFGSTVAASATFIFMFTLFGEFLEYSGAGQFFIDLAFRSPARQGAAPKMAVIASGLMGMISGSSTANVTSTGVYTIPLMKKTGYRSEFAGAVRGLRIHRRADNAACHGAASFLLAEYVGIPYIKLCAAAAIPAILYYVAIFTAVHFEAVRTGLKGAAPDENAKSWQWLLLHKGYLSAPIFVILITMILGLSAYKAALYGIPLDRHHHVCGEKRGRIDWRALVRTLARGGRNAVLIAVTCAAAGIVIGVSNETGIGVKFASIIISLGHNNLYLILPMVMLASIVLGMGLPTSACYIMVAAIAVPALIKMDCNTMASHMFALYFGVFSGITPPVAISAYAAAGLAKSPPMKTGWLAVGLSLPAFIIPYSFIYNPSLILEGTIAGTVWVIFQCIVGIFGMASGVIGCAFRPVAVWERIVLVVLSAFMVVSPNVIASVVCMVIVGGLLITNRIRAKDWTAPEKGAIV